MVVVLKGAWRELLRSSKTPPWTTLTTEPHRRRRHEGAPGPRAPLGADGQGFLTTVEPPVTVTALVAVPAVAVPGERVVVVVFEMTPSSPTVITVFTVRTAEITGIAVFGGAPTAAR